MGEGVGVGVAKPGSLHRVSKGNQAVTAQLNWFPEQHDVPPKVQISFSLRQNGVGTGVGLDEGVGDGDGVG